MQCETEETKTLFQGSKNFFRDFSEGHTQGFFNGSCILDPQGRVEIERCKIGDVMFTEEVKKGNADDSEESR